MQNDLVYRMMKDLIQYTRERALKYKTFTGAFLVKQDQIIWRDITSIEIDNNPLAHAELKVLQGALSIMDGNLEGSHLYTTQQPCPMCASAIAWCGIKSVFFGIPSSHHWRYSGEIFDFFSNLDIQCTGSILEDECKAIDEYLIANGI